MVWLDRTEGEGREDTSNLSRSLDMICKTLEQ